MALSPSDPTPVPIAAGVIERSGRFLVARRPAAAHAGGTWEFPGGKLRPGEGPLDALRREMEEEVGVQFRSAVLLDVTQHAYPERTVLLHFYLCLEPQAEPEAREGQELRWVTLEEIESLEIPAANRGVVRLLAEQFGDG